MGGQYFEVVLQQRERLAVLELRVLFLEGKCGLTAEALHERKLALLGRVASRGFTAHLACWHAAALREEGWRMLRTRVEQRWRASGAQRANDPTQKWDPTCPHTHPQLSMWDCNMSWTALHTGKYESAFCIYLHFLQINFHILYFFIVSFCIFCNQSD